MSETNNYEVAELEKILDKAAPGPWSTDTDIAGLWDAKGEPIQTATPYAVDDTSGQGWANARLLALAHLMARRVLELSGRVAELEALKDVTRDARPGGTEAAGHSEFEYCPRCDEACPRCDR